MNKKLYKLTSDTQKSIGALSELAYETGVQDGLIKANALNALKPLGNTSMRWIPCSERLPEKLGEYLVTVKTVGWNQEETTEIDITYWDDLEGFYKAEKVIAWMPMPEPYEERKEQ